MRTTVHAARAGRHARGRTHRLAAGALAALLAGAVTLSGLAPAMADGPTLDVVAEPAVAPDESENENGIEEATPEEVPADDETAAPEPAAPEESPAPESAVPGAAATEQADPVAAVATPTPAADADAATITVHVGGYRTGESTVSGLSGVTLGLFATEDAPTPVAGDWATATSDASGVVTFTVPGDRIGSSTRYWVKGISGVGGYALTTELTTAPITDPDKDQTRTYAFQTPKLAKGGSYESGKDFMTLPTKGTDYTASEGQWALSYANPTLDQQCGVKVALVVDLSASVLQAHATEALHQAAKTYVDALLGTPSQVQLFSFGTTATVQSGLTPVSTQASVDALDAKIDTLTPKNTSYTNWDDALWTVTQQPGAFDLAVVVTDGNPTVYAASQAGKNTRFAEIEAGIFSANALKLEGTRIVALGVGDGVGSTGAGVNLQAISGADAFVQSGSYEHAGEWLRDSVFTACTPSLTVVKEVVGLDGATSPAGGWTFDATTASPLISALADHGTTAAGTGAVNFPVAFTSTTATAVPITITERQQPAYQLLQASGKNAVCTVKNKENPTGTALTVTNTGALGFTIPMSAGDMVSCTVTNEPAALAALTATTTATGDFDRDYDWAIDKSVDRSSAEVSAGENASFEYTVRVTPSGPFDSGYGVSGTLVVSNPNAFAVEASLSAVATAGGVPVGTLTVAQPTVTVPAHGSVTVAYSGELGDTLPGGALVVTGTATWTHPALPGGPTSTASDASGQVAFTTPTVVTDGTATVADVFDAGTADDASDDVSAGLVTDEAPLDAAAILARPAGERYWETTYSRSVGAALTAGDTGTYHNVATVTPSHDDPETDDETVTVTVPGIYDLALRVWVSQVHRDGSLVYQLHAGAEEPGPDYHIPYVEVQVGDLLTHDLRLFNQGSRTARVTQVVDYVPAGLELVQADGVGDGWSLAANGNLYLNPAEPIVLAPGQELDVHLVLRVTESADADAVIENYAEISGFEGLVPAQPAPMVLAAAAPVTFGTFAIAGPLVAPVETWATVEDADSQADDDNGWVQASALGAKFENNEIAEHDTTDEPDADGNDVDNDQDDHDGNFLRLVSFEIPTEDPTDEPTPDSTTETTSDPVVVASEPQQPGTPGRLASTGATVWAVAGPAAVLLAGGVVLLVVRRRLGEGGHG